jgi:hypothetical protein
MEVTFKIIYCISSRGHPTRDSPPACGLNGVLRPWQRTFGLHKKKDGNFLTSSANISFPRWILPRRVSYYLHVLLLLELCLEDFVSGNLGHSVKWQDFLLVWLRELTPAYNTPSVLELFIIFNSRPSFQFGDSFCNFSEKSQVAIPHVLDFIHRLFFKKS